MATATHIFQATPALHHADRVLPEHETQWPATEEACALVQARYDGTMSTSKAIGDELRGPGGTYPSWRIEQLAQTLGIVGERLAQTLARSRDQEKSDQPTRQRQMGARHAASAPTLPTLPQMATCETCGQSFVPWKAGRGVTKRFCQTCYKMRAHAWRSKDEKNEDDAPMVPSEPTAPPQPTQIITLPHYAAPAQQPDEELVTAFIRLLPHDRRWTMRARRRWLAAFTATLDLLIEVEDANDQEAHSHE